VSQLHTRFTRLDNDYALCNAHHLRELERAWEQDGQAWAKQMKGLLETINRKVIDAGGALDDKGSKKWFMMVYYLPAHRLSHLVVNILFFWF